MKSNIEEMKNVPICDLFYCVTMDTIGPLLETINGKKYVFATIDHYSKWCEAQFVKEHDALTATKFLEDEVICKYGVPKYIIIDNNSEQMKEFAKVCQNYGIMHQFIALA